MQIEVSKGNEAKMARFGHARGSKVAKKNGLRTRTKLGREGHASTPDGISNSKTS